MALVNVGTNNGVGMYQVVRWLEKFLVYKYLINKYLFVEVSILVGLGLNNWPIQLDLDLKIGPHNRPFRFGIPREILWLLEGIKIHGMNKKHTFKELKMKINY